MANSLTSGVIAHNQAQAYALAKQIPDLAQRGCTIQTAYGDITIPPGPLAVQLAQVLNQALTKGGVL